MRRTRKWAYVAQEATRLVALGLSEREVAKRLGVSKSTVTRWKAAGKLPRTAQAPAAAPSEAGGGRPKQTPQEWAAAVREAYDLDATDEQLVSLAELALALSLDATIAAHVRMTAAGRFQAVVRQLALVARGAESEHQAPASSQPAAAEAPSRKNPMVRRPAGDPRKLLMVVK